MDTATDIRGVKRGKCKQCTGCEGYKWLQQLPGCANCGCAPGKHWKLGIGVSHTSLTQAKVAGQSTSLEVNIESSPSDKCLVCGKSVYFDVNTGYLFKFCESHLHQQQPLDLESGSGGEDDMAEMGHFMRPAGMHSQYDECAIEECSQPRHVDARGFVHQCCGYTHAMEHIRRQMALKHMNEKPVVKGVSHCLLAECSRVTWPFMNYCGRTHAQLGMKRGLVPPPTSIVQPKDSSMCELPGCSRMKYVDGGKLFDFCGKKHAAEARDLKQTGEQVIAKDGSMCIIPECTKPKFRDPITGKEHEYCGKWHAKEAKTRNIKPAPAPLISMSDVMAFLKNFTILQVVNIDENDHAKSGGVLYKKFIAAKNALPQCYQNTCLAFHGTAAANIPSICKDGYDASKRSSQAYGPGEYFAATPNTPLSYCNGGKKILLNELLLGQEGVDHTKSGDIIVMKNPEHDLPRFVVTFQ